MASWLNPLYPPSYVYFEYKDLNHNGLTDPNEVLTGAPCGYCSAPSNRSYNTLNPGSIVQSNALAPGFHAPTTDELLLGVEHSLLPEFVVGVNLTYRKLNDYASVDPLVFDGDANSPENLQTPGRRAKRSDFVAVTKSATLPNGQATNYTYYVLRDGLSSRQGGYIFNSDVSSTYKGASLTFNKRLANHWMMRGNFSYQDWKWNVPDNALADPTDTLPGGAVDGEAVLQGSGSGGGAKGGVYLNSKWSYNVTGLYEVASDRPWGFNVAGSLTGRQGYASPYFARQTDHAVYGGSSVLATKADAFRNDDLRVLDLRIEKPFSIDDFTATVSIDCFNALNAGTVLQRSLRLNTRNTAYATEVLSPRIFRLGLRLSFR